MVSSFGSRSSRRIALSVSQKNLASDSRARTTRSLPAVMARPPSLATRFEVRTKAGARRVGAGLAQHEALLVGPDGGADGLGRDVEEGFVEGAHQHHGPFDEAGDLLQQPLVLDEFEAAREGEVAGVVQDDVLAPLRRRARPWRAPGPDVIVEAADLDGLGRQEAVAVGGGAGRDPVDRERHHVGRLGLGPEGARRWIAADAPSAGRRAGPRPAPQRIDFGQGKLRMIWGRISARTSRVARPGRSITAT